MTTPSGKVLRADEIGPYPQHEYEVTAGRLIRYYLASTAICEQEAQDAVAQDDGSREGGRQMARAAGRFVGAWTSLALLRRVRDLDPAAADDVALSIWRAWEAGDTMHELLWEWKRAEGIDPDVRIEARS